MQKTVKRTSVISGAALALACAAMGGCGPSATGDEGSTDALPVEDLALHTNAAGHGNPNPGIAPLQSRSHGKSYGGWAAAWQQWALQPPAAVSPIADDTGANCAQGQSGGVWFLAGNFGGATTRSCRVPRGKALFFPMLNYFWVVFKTDPPPNTVDAIRPVMTAAMDGAVVSAEIDGRPVKSASSYRVRSDVFSESFAPGNIFGVTSNECDLGPSGNPTCTPSLNEGYYLMVEPLCHGKHTVHFAGAVADGSFSVDVTYNITVD